MDETGYRDPRDDSYPRTHDTDYYRPPQRSHGMGAAIVAGLVTALVVSSIVGFLAGMAGAWVTRLGGDGGAGGGPQSVRVVGGTTDEPVAAAASAAVPSVVNIDVSSRGQQEGGEGGLPEGHPGVPMQGNGSGVAFREAPDGGTYIITNEHVVESADTIRVTDSEGNRMSARLVGRDAETDIAVIRVDRRIPVIAQGDSDDVKVGSLTVAIGSPFGLQHSVTSGVVSATHRSLPDQGNDQTATYPLVDVIQTDAPINPGNSGGALVDRRGRLIGINTAIFSAQGSNAGIGFAVPQRTAVRIAVALIDKGRAEHPFLGVVGQTVDERVARERDLPVEEGALVIEVTEDTEAQRAGIRSGDVIVGLDDAKVRSMDDLILEVRRHDVGDEVTVHLYRRGERTRVQMTVGTKPENLPRSQEPTGQP